MNKMTTPAHTYATPSRAVNSVSKMHVNRGGKEVRFVVAKDSHGRYFPVFLDRIQQVSDAEMEANPSANVAKRRQARKVGRPRKVAKTAQRRAPRKVAKKAPAKKAAKKTLH